MTRAHYRPPWRIDIDVRPGVHVPLSVAAIVRAASEALDAAEAPSPASLGLILSDDAELARLNSAHMGKQGPTDVLSFPLLPRAAFVPGAPTPLVPRPPGSRLHLGDIVISVERAAAQASSGRGGQTGDVRWAAADELSLLITHGVLHVCGWDHDAPAEETAMRALEQRLLATR